MAISHYIKEIGRGKSGARSLDRAQSADLLLQVLDGVASDVEVGAFCLAMRIKGESAEEMAGFLDAAHARIRPILSNQALVAIPSYNGARKLPGLTVLLAALLAREGKQRGFGVVIHGCSSEAARVPTQDVHSAVFQEALQVQGASTLLDIAHKATQSTQVIDECIAHMRPLFVPTSVLCPGLHRLLNLRRSIGLRNPAHSLVKLMNPSKRADTLIVSSYTHPEYLSSMTATLQLIGGHAMLLRGTEGECVADARRRPRMDGFLHGLSMELCAAQEGSLLRLPDLPKSCDAASTASYIGEVLAAEKAIPEAIAVQVEHILLLLAQLKNTRSKA